MRFLLRMVVVAHFASTAGATLAFLLSRWLFRDAIGHHFGDRLVKFNEALQHNLSTNNNAEATLALACGVNQRYGLFRRST